MTLEDYPAAHRWGTFYGQSASVVDYLVNQKSPADFIQFVELALEQGYDVSLRQVYGIAGIAQLEQDWQAQARRPEPRTGQTAGTAVQDDRSAPSNPARPIAWRPPDASVLSQKFLKWEGRVQHTSCRCGQTTCVFDRRVLRCNELATQDARPSSFSGRGPGRAAWPN